MHRKVNFAVKSLFFNAHTASINTLLKELTKTGLPGLPSPKNAKLRVQISRATEGRFALCSLLTKPNNR